MSARRTRCCADWLQVPISDVSWVDITSDSFTIELSAIGAVITTPFANLAATRFIDRARCLFFKVLPDAPPACLDVLHRCQYNPDDESHLLRLAFPGAASYEPAKHRMSLAIPDTHIVSAPKAQRTPASVEPTEPTVHVPTPSHDALPAHASATERMPGELSRDVAARHERKKISRVGTNMIPSRPSETIVTLGAQALVQDGMFTEPPVPTPAAHHPLGVSTASPASRAPVPPSGQPERSKRELVKPKSMPKQPAADVHSIARSEFDCDDDSNEVVGMAASGRGAGVGSSLSLPTQELGRVGSRPTRVRKLRRYGYESEDDVSGSAAPGSAQRGGSGGAGTIVSHCGHSARRTICSSAVHRPEAFNRRAVLVQTRWHTEP